MKVLLNWRNPANHDTDYVEEHDIKYKTNEDIYVTQQEFMVLSQNFTVDVNVIDMTAEDPMVKHAKVPEYDSGEIPKRDQADPVTETYTVSLAEKISNEISCFDVILETVIAKAKEHTGEEPSIDAAMASATALYISITKGKS